MFIESFCCSVVHRANSPGIKGPGYLFYTLNWSHLPEHRDTCT